MAVKSKKKHPRLLQFIKKRHPRRLLSKENPQLFHLLSNSFSDEVMLIRSDGTVAYVNDAAVKGIGLPRNKILEKSAYKLLDRKMTFAKWCKKYFLPIKKQGKVTNVQIERVTSSKKTQTLEANFVYIVNNGDEYLLSTAHDITSRLLMRNKLKESQSQYRLLSEGAADGIFTADCNGRITYANDALQRLVRISLQEAKGKNFRRFIDKASLFMALRCFNRAKNGHSHVKAEFDVLDRNGEKICVEVNASPLRQHNKIVGVHAIIRDIRDRKTLENLLRESEEKYRDLFEDSTDALIITDLNGKIIDVNHKAERLFQGRKKKIIRASEAWLYPAHVAHEYRSKFEEALKGKNKPYDVEIINQKGVIIPVSIFGRRIKVGKNTVVLIRFIDLSERICNEQKKREIDKMEALSLFVAGTAQEIQRPLEAILMYSQHIIDEYQNKNFEYIGFRDFKNIIGTLHTINNQIQHCCDVTNKLLTLSKKRIGLKSDSCNLNLSIHFAADMLAQQLSLNNVKLVLKLNNSLPFVLINAADFNQVAGNIMANAVQSMPAGGNITIRSFFKKRENKIYVDFIDNGVGIPKDVLSRVFEPFFTTKQAGPGQSVGLGLAVVNSIIKNCNGEVAIKSSLRDGTRVRIMIPAVPKN